MSAKLRVVTSGHLTKMAVIPSHPLYSRTSCYTQTSWLCVLQIQSYCRPKFYIGGIGIYYLDLFLWTWAWPDDIYELDPYSLDIYIPDVQIWTSYVKAFESYRLTDIQTDRHDRNYIPRCFACGHKQKCVQLSHIEIRSVERGICSVAKSTMTELFL